MELNIGLVETPGELIGDNLDSLELECINIILLLKMIVHGGLFNQRLNGSILNKNLKLYKCERRIDLFI